MANANALTRISKFLSFVLRHQPQSIGLTVDSQGWARVDELIHLANRQGKHLSRRQIEQIVSQDEKGRYALSDDGSLIRANQGHSIAVDVGLESVAPPAWLYHGTVTRYLDAIREQGLLPGARQFVHLSKDYDTARMVGSRRGKAVVLRVAAGAMYQDGMTFYLSKNKVWLTKYVPADYLTIH